MSLAIKPRTWLAGSFCLLAACCGAEPCRAQGTGATATKAPATNAPATKTPVPAPAAVGKPAKPEQLDLVTVLDKVEIKATYYPSSLGKRAPVVLVLHDYKGRRTEYAGLAESLQKEGFAVVTVDLRGHGDSTKIQQQQGQKLPQSIEAGKLKKGADFQWMWGPKGDLSAVREFLKEKNDEGELNINATGIVGVGMGATVALQRTYVDYYLEEERKRRTPNVITKKGADVRALALVSPAANYNGINSLDTLKKLDLTCNFLGVQPAVLLISGGKDKKNTDQLLKLIDPRHPNQDALEVKDRTLIVKNIKGDLTGTPLVTKTKDVNAMIVEFMKFRLLDQIKDFEWSTRND